MFLGAKVAEKALAVAKDGVGDVGATKLAVRARGKAAKLDDFAADVSKVTHKSMCMCVYVYVCVCVYTYTQRDSYVYVYTYTQGDSCESMYIHTHTYAYICIRTRSSCCQNG